MRENVHLTRLIYPFSGVGPLFMLYVDKIFTRQTDEGINNYSLNHLIDFKTFQTHKI